MTGTTTHLRAVPSRLAERDVPEEDREPVPGL